MADKPVPEFIKLYMERCGHDSWLDYTRLSRDYHATKQVYHEKKYPNYIPNTPYSRQVSVDIETDLRRIDAEFKERALQIGCKYGYEEPGRQDYDGYMSERQESGMYRDVIDKDDFGLLPEDVRAKQAHEAFDKKFPEKAQDRGPNRDIIEDYFGDARSLSFTEQKESQLREGKGKGPEKAKEQQPQKTEPTRHDRVSKYSLTRDDIVSPANPGLSLEDGEIDRDLD